MKVSIDDLDRPFPLLWWKRRALPGVRKMCGKQWRLADSAAELLWEDYRQNLDRETHSRIEPDFLVQSLVEMHLVAHSHHRETVRAGVERLVPDPELRKWIHTNEGDIRDLVDWNLLYLWFNDAFSSGGMCFSFNDEQWFTVENPARYATGHADAAFVAVTGGGISSAESCLYGGALVMERTFEPPPWNLP